MSGGGAGNFMTARGAGDLLTRTTEILAASFFLLCLLMTLLSGHNHAASIVDRVKINGIIPPQPVAQAPAVPATGPANGATPGFPAATPAQRAPTGPVGLFGETQGAPRAKPAGGAAANPLANITVQSSAPPASH